MQRFASEQKRDVDRETKRKRQRGEFKMVLFRSMPSLVGAGFHAAVLHCAAVA